MMTPLRLRADVRSPLVALALLVIASLVAPVATAQTQACPIIGDGAVSAAVGSPVSASPYMVVDSGSAVQCLFAGDGVGDGVLVGQYPSFFAGNPAELLGVDQDHLRMLLASGLAAQSAVVVTPVGGVGDAGVWVVPTDMSTAPDRLGRLLIRRGDDAIVVGTQDGPTAMDTAIAVAQAVLAASP